MGWNREEGGSEEVRNNGEVSSREMAFEIGVTLEMRPGIRGVKD